MICALISQATDEAPLLQQSVQQNQLAPGAGFQPWVHTHSTRPPLVPLIRFFFPPSVYSLRQLGEPECTTAITASSFQSVR